MRCFKLIVLIAIVQAIFLACKSKQQVNVTTRMQSTSVLDSFDYTIVALPYALPSLNKLPVSDGLPSDSKQSAVQMNQLSVPVTYKITGHRITQLSDTTQFQQHTTSRHHDSQDIVLGKKDWLVRVIEFLVIFLVLALALRVLRV